MFGVFLLAVSASAVPAPNPSTEATIAALVKGLEQWRNDVRFRSTYRFRQGYAKAVEAGLRDGVDPSIKEPAGGVFEATGVFHKKDNLMRFSLDYGQPPVPVQPPPGGPAPPPGGRAVRNVSYDEVTNGRIQVRYHPGASGDNVIVGRRRPEVIGAGQLSQTESNPLYPYQNPRFDPFTLWDLGAGQLPAGREVVTVDDSHRAVVLSQDGAWKQSRRVLFQTKPAPAVITQIVEVTTRPNGKASETHIRLSDFRDCPGGRVARRVVTVGTNEGGRVVVREWVSNDLGDVPPTNTDFVIRIAENTSVGGYRQAPPRGANDRRIDISTITEDDLDNGVR